MIESLKDAWQFCSFPKRTKQEEVCEMKILRWLPVLVLLGFLMPTACDDALGPTDGPARIQILLTDAPTDYLDEAWVCFSSVYLVPGEDREEDEGAEQGPNWVYLFDGSDFDESDPEAEKYKCYDLLELRDGITADLTDAVDVEPGEYGQLRLVVSEAWVILDEDYQFNDGEQERSLFIPSGAQTGIKVHLHRSIEAEEGTLTEIIVDFDVDENFVIQGNPDSPAGIQGILFTPVLKEKSRTTEGT